MLVQRKEKIVLKRVLLVYPEFPPLFWGFKYVLEFIGKRSSNPPKEA